MAEFPFNDKEVPIKRMNDSMKDHELRQKQKKAKGELRTWFEMYIELRSELTSRIFQLEERVKYLENKNPRLK